MLLSKLARCSLRPEQGRSGTSVVETAIVLPIFLLFLFALFEFGRVFFVTNMLKHAARTAARKAIAREATLDDVETAVKEQLGSITGYPPKILVKDARSLDPTGSSGPIDYDSLPDYQLGGSESDSSVAGDLFLVRVEIPYAAVSLLRSVRDPEPDAKIKLKRLDDSNFEGDNALILSGQAVMRRE